MLEESDDDVSYKKETSGPQENVSISPRFAPYKCFQESDNMDEKRPAKPTGKKLYREKIYDSRRKRAAAMLEESDYDVSYKGNLWTPTNASILPRFAHIWFSGVR